MTVPIPVHRPFTRAQVKLARRVEQSGTITAAARQLGLRPSTLRLLLYGASVPNGTTIDRMRAEGVDPSDWFEQTEGVR